MEVAFAYTASFASKLDFGTWSFLVADGNPSTTPCSCPCCPSFFEVPFSFGIVVKGNRSEHPRIFFGGPSKGHFPCDFGICTADAGGVLTLSQKHPRDPLVAWLELGEVCGSVDGNRFGMMPCDRVCNLRGPLSVVWRRPWWPRKGVRWVKKPGTLCNVSIICQSVYVIGVL